MSNRDVLDCIVWRVVGFYFVESEGFGKQQLVLNGVQPGDGWQLPSGSVTLNVKTAIDRIQIRGTNEQILQIYAVRAYQSTYVPIRYI